jgi:pheromone shutdown-related protein TraB
MLNSILVKQTVQLGDREVTVVGTSHVSEESRQEVEDTIDEVRPDLVGVELDENRLESLRGEDAWTQLDIAEALRDGKGYLLFLNVVLSIYQRQVGMDQGSMPGEEMLAAVEKAEENNTGLALVDRDINETFRRGLQELTITEKLKLFASLFATTEEVEPGELMDGNMVENLVEELKDEYPSLSRTFLEERNQYMAEKLLENDFDKAVLVVGAAHLEGVVEELKEQNGYSPVDSGTIPWSTILKYGMPAFILIGLGYSFFKIGFATGVEASVIWILINGVLATAGAIVAKSHPLTWIVSFISAPLTSLDPALGAGMVAAYAEAKIRPPKVEELESISKIESYWSLWDNQVGRVLLTFFFVSIGSAAATFISAGYIASLISGL